MAESVELKFSQNTMTTMGRHPGPRTLIGCRDLVMDADWLIQEKGRGLVRLNS